MSRAKFSLLNGPLKGKYNLNLKGDFSLVEPLVLVKDNLDPLAAPTTLNDLQSMYALEDDNAYDYLDYVVESLGVKTAFRYEYVYTKLYQRPVYVFTGCYNLAASYGQRGLCLNLTALSPLVLN